MASWGRRVRAAIVMGLTWAVGWSFAGGVLARIPGFDSDLPFPILFAPLGFITGVIFSGILVAAGRRRGFDRLSVPRFAAWGALSGLALSGIVVAGAAVRGAPLMPEFLLFGPPLAIASAACAAGSLALARRATRGELGAGGDPALSELTSTDERELLERRD